MSRQQVEELRQLYSAEPAGSHLLGEAQYAEGNISCPRKESNSVIQPEASHFTGKTRRFSARHLNSSTVKHKRNGSDIQKKVEPQCSQFTKD
jgi:hypothetical protein